MIKDLSRRQLDGMIIAGAADAAEAVAAAEEHRVAADSVFIDTAQGLHGHQTVGADKYAGALQAVRHLLDVHDHENVALIMGRGPVRRRTSASSAGGIACKPLAGRPGWRSTRPSPGRVATSLGRSCWPDTDLQPCS